MTKPSSADTSFEVGTDLANPPTASSWEVDYARRLFLTDSIVVVWAVVGAQLMWFGSVGFTIGLPFIGEVDYGVISAVTALGWIFSLGMSGSRDPRVLGIGATEYQRVFTATFAWFGAIAIIAMLGQINASRGYLAVALPLGLVALLLSRKLWRIWLVAQRETSANYSARVMVVGAANRVSSIVRELQKTPEAGYSVVGVCIPDGSVLDDDIVTDTLAIETLKTDPVIAMRAAGGDTIAVAGGDRIRGPAIKRMSWQLVPGQEHLIVTPSLIDIAGPRLQTRPVASLGAMIRTCGWSSAG